MKGNKCPGQQKLVPFSGNLSHFTPSSSVWCWGVGGWRRRRLLEISLAVGLGRKPTGDGLFPGSLHQLAARRPAQNNNLLLSGYEESQPFRGKHTGFRPACAPAGARLITGLREHGGAGHLGQTPLVLPTVSPPQPRSARSAVTRRASQVWKMAPKGLLAPLALGFIPLELTASLAEPARVRRDLV